MVNGGSASRIQIYVDGKHMFLNPYTSFIRSNCCERSVRALKKQRVERVINSRDLSNKFHVDRDILEE